jgi:hypothetical protein
MRGKCGVLGMRIGAVRHAGMGGSNAQARPVFRQAPGSELRRIPTKALFSLALRSLLSTSLLQEAILKTRLHFFFLRRQV